VRCSVSRRIRRPPHRPASAGGVERPATASPGHRARNPPAGFSHPPAPAAPPPGPRCPRRGR
jgi:hypothetical protein